MEHHARSLEEWQLHGFGKRAVLEALTGDWLGFVELSLVGPGKGCREDDVEIGYFIVPQRWGEGLATEAAVAVRDEAFGRVGLYELIGRSRDREHGVGPCDGEGGLPPRAQLHPRGGRHRRHPPHQSGRVAEKQARHAPATPHGRVPASRDGDRRAEYRETG